LSIYVDKPWIETINFFNPTKDLRVPEVRKVLSFLNTKEINNFSIENILDLIKQEIQCSYRRYKIKFSESFTSKKQPNFKAQANEILIWQNGVLADGDYFCYSLLLPGNKTGHGEVPYVAISKDFGGYDNINIAFYIPSPYLASFRKLKDYQSKILDIVIEDMQKYYIPETDSLANLLNVLKLKTGCSYDLNNVPGLVVEAEESGNLLNLKL
jgi:hypothetical protein